MVSVTGSSCRLHLNPRVIVTLGNLTTLERIGVSAVLADALQSAVL